jgi:glucuronoarabinoxylan endo-1,4-beta-xylanase
MHATRTALAAVTVALLIAGLRSPTCAAALTIDPATTYQTIDAFGACANSMAKWRVRQGPFYVDVPYTGQWDTIAGELGATGIRIMTSDTFDHTIPTQMVEHVVQLHSRGINLFWASILSPPGYMKTNGSVNNGGHLLSQYYGAFANMVVHYIDTLKQLTGVELWGISLQNELLFAEPYASCEYTTAEYKAVVAVVGARLAGSGFATRIMGSEHMLWGFPSYESPVMSDGATAPYLQRFIVHTYTNGVTPTPGDQAVTQWVPAATYSGQQNRPIWMSETSGYDTAWTGAMELWVGMYAALKYGKCSGWMFLNLSTYNGTEFCLMQAGSFTRLGAVSKHFFRYVRPGAQMVSCKDSPTDSVFACAFKQTGTSFTIVMMNSAASQRVVPLIGSGLPASFTVYQSTTSTVCVNVGTATTSVTMPAKSVVTLYNGPATAVRPRAAAAPAAATRLSTSAGRLYSLDGRLATGRAAAGVRLAVDHGRVMGVRVAGLTR